MRVNVLRRGASFGDLLPELPTIPACTPLTGTSIQSHTHGSLGFSVASIAIIEIEIRRGGNGEEETRDAHEARHVSRNRCG